MKILSVDDDPIILGILGQVFSTMDDHVMVAAASAQDALTLLEQEDDPFDCFFLDIRMPGMDGTALAGLIRKIKKYEAAPILMLTAMSETRYIDGAFAAGATDYVSKPFDLKELRARVNVIHQLVQSRKTTSKQAANNATEQLDFAAQIDLHDIDRVISMDAMKNYLAQLSRTALFGSTVFAVTLRNPASYFDRLSADNVRLLLADVAGVISDTLSYRHALISYAGNGTYVCVTESRGRPDTAAIADRINLNLNRAGIIPDGDTVMPPRVSVGVAVRLAWKSGEQILGSLVTAQTSAEKAAAEHERLNYDHFDMEEIA